MGEAFDNAIQSYEEILLCGAAGTGKTLRILYFLNHVLWTYPKSRVLIMRKTRADLAQSTLVTYERDIMGFDNPIVSAVQRTSRQSYKYPNGSELVVGGMNRPGRVLSAEYDVIYAAEAVQFELEDWETLIMRLRAGPYPHPLLIADTNPDRPDHWLKQRSDEGMVKLLNTFHRDNPAYWDAEAQTWTKRGENYVQGKLQRLSGVRRERYLNNKWVIADGAIYDEWNESIHLIDEDQLPKLVRYIAAIDFGYTHPFVWQLWGLDYDGRMYLLKEIYMSERLVEDHAKQIRELSGRLKIEATFSDHDAEDRATLHRHGVQTQAAHKSVLDGIQATKERLRVAGDGKPRLFIVRGARQQMDQTLRDAGLPTSTQEEFTAYVWNNKKKQDTPTKEYDHGMDTMRYAVMGIDQIGRNRIKVTKAPSGITGHRG